MEKNLGISRSRIFMQMRKNYEKEKAKIQKNESEYSKKKLAESRFKEKS